MLALPARLVQAKTKYTRQKVNTMSNNHSHDNIYSILGKLEALKPTAQETHDATVKAIYESVEAQGSITKGVSSVESKLMEKYMGFDKTVAAIKKGGSAENPEAVAASIGRKKYGKAKFQKAAAAGKKLGEEYDREADVKNVAQQYMQANGIQSVHDLGAEDIEYIGQECQCNYAGVCEILGCELPDELGPVDSYDEHGDLEEKAPPGEKAERMVKHIKQGYAKDGKLTDKEKAIAYATTWAAHNKGQVEEDEMCEACGETMEGCGCEKTNEAEITRKPGVTTHRKTDFPGYPADDIDDLDDLRGPGTGKRGRPRKHAAKAPTGLGRGRPVKAKAPTYSTSNDPFGRVPSKAPKGTKGTVHSMAESMTNLEKSLRRISEGVNFAELLKEKHQTVDEMLAQLGDDIKLFKETGHCSELLRDCMEIKGYHGKMVADEAAQTVPPAAPSKGIPGNLPIPGKMDRLNQRGPDYYEEDAMADELNELAKLAGLQTAEGNAFTGKLASTPKGGSFELDGKTFKDTSTLDEEPNEGNAFSGAVAKAKADGVQPGEKITVGGKEYPVKEADVTVDEPSEDDLANDPEEKYGTVKQITTQGDDMNRQKRQDPHTANKAANPLTNDTLALEAKLAAEYESIKKVSN